MENKDQPGQQPQNEAPINGADIEAAEALKKEAAGEPHKRPSLDMSDEDANALVGPLAYALSVLGIYEGNTQPDRASFEKVHGALAIKLALEAVHVMRGSDLTEDDRVKSMVRNVLRAYPLSVGHMAMLNGLEPGKEVRAHIGVQDREQNEVASVEVRVARKARILLAGVNDPRMPRR